MGSRSVDNILNLADSYFLNDVTDIVKCYARQKKQDCVVVFPTYSNYRRYLIHRACEPFKEQGLTTFSIGEGDKRRTVLCYAQQIISECVGSTSSAEAMGVDKRSKDAGDTQGNIYRPPPLRRSAHSGGGNSSGSNNANSISPQQMPCREPVKKEPEKDKETATSGRTKRPDREVYVPRQRRAVSTTPGGREDSTVSPTSATHTSRKLRLSDKSYCNVYTPPHARASRTSNASVVNHNSGEKTDVIVNKQTSNRKRQLSDDGSDGPVTPPASVEHINHTADDTQEHLIDLIHPTAVDDDFKMSINNCQQIINNGDADDVSNSDTIMWNSHHKDEDREQTELERATQEINRSNRRLIKQSFVSDVLVISEPDDERRTDKVHDYKEAISRSVQDDAIEDINIIDDDKRKKDIFNPEEEEWEAMLGEDGECLEPSMLAELNTAVGRVTIQTPRSAPFRPGPDKDPFSHVLEVYNFPAQFTTNDLLSVFNDFKDTGFEIKWVDDYHALAVFSSAKIAEDVLAYNHPMVKTRPLHEGTQESRQKAKKCAEYLQPYRTRPETCPALARRLVTGALGVRLPTMSQERIQEKKVLSQFKEKKRMETQMREKLREAAWDGSLGSGNDTS